MKYAKYLVILALTVIIGGEIASCYRVKHLKKPREMPKIGDLKQEYLTQNTAKYIIGENLDKSDIEVNPNRYIILNGMDEAHDPEIKKWPVYEKDKKPYYPYINPNHVETATMPDLPIPKMRYTSNIYPLDRNPYYGQTQDYRHIMNLPKDKLAVPIEFGDLSKTHSDPSNLAKLERQLSDIDKTESLNSISMSGKYISDSKPYYDPTRPEKELLKTELRKTIENMKEDLLHPNIPNLKFEKINADPRVQNWKNSNREETNEFIANSYHYPIIKDKNGYDVAGPVGNDSKVVLEGSQPEFPEGHYRTYERLVKEKSVIGVEEKEEKPVTRVLPEGWVEGTARKKPERVSEKPTPSNSQNNSKYVEADENNKTITEAESVGEKLGSKYVNDKNEPVYKPKYVEADSLSKKIVEADLKSTRKNYNNSSGARITPQILEHIESSSKGELKRSEVVPTKGQESSIKKESSKNEAASVKKEQTTNNTNNIVSNKQETNNQIDTKKESTTTISNLAPPKAGSIQNLKMKEQASNTNEVAKKSTIIPVENKQATVTKVESIAPKSEITKKIEATPISVENKPEPVTKVESVAPKSEIAKKIEATPIPVANKPEPVTKVESVTTKSEISKKIEATPIPVDKKVISTKEESVVPKSDIPKKIEATPIPIENKQLPTTKVESVAAKSDIPKKVDTSSIPVANIKTVATTKVESAVADNISKETQNEQHNAIPSKEQPSNKLDKIVEASKNVSTNNVEKSSTQIQNSEKKTSDLSLNFVELKVSQIEPKVEIKVDNPLTTNLKVSGNAPIIKNDNAVSQGESKVQNKTEVKETTGNSKDENKTPITNENKVSPVSTEKIESKASERISKSEEKKNEIKSNNSLKTNDQKFLVGNELQNGYKIVTNDEISPKLNLKQMKRMRESNVEAKTVSTKPEMEMLNSKKTMQPMYESVKIVPELGKEFNVAKSSSTAPRKYYFYY